MASTLAPPSWLSRALARFPLHTYPASASATSSTAAKDVGRPTLFVLPPHPATASSWASADPRCLRAQLELLFRTAADHQDGTAQEPALDVVFLDPRTEDFVWGPGGQLPFLQLPLAVGSRNPASRLVGVARLQHWLDNYHPYSWDRLETQGDTMQARSGPYADEPTRLESQAWITLLETKAMAGVLLQMLALPAAHPRPDQQPALLTRLLAANQLPSALYHLALLRKLSFLTPLRPTSHPSPRPAFLAWLGTIEFTHPFSVPAAAQTDKSASVLLGESEPEREEELGDIARSGDWRAGAASRSDRDEARVMELAAREGSGSYLDIMRAACDAIEAMGTRMEADGDGAETRWALGADKPAPLDALLMSILHTILSLPAEHRAAAAAQPDKAALSPADLELEEEDDAAFAIKAPAQSLREAIERHPVLVHWTRRVWRECVKPATIFTPVRN